MPKIKKRGIRNRYNTNLFSTTAPTKLMNRLWSTTITPPKLINPKKNKIPKPVSKSTRKSFIMLTKRISKIAKVPEKTPATNRSMSWSYT